MSITPKDIEPVPMPVHQTWDSLISVVEAAQKELPYMTPNELATWFGIYHNTLIAKLTHQEEEKKY
ncbi:MAG: hypothetical protein DI616_15725 [Paracoccus denitrificans]|uniref:Uncharacterized protein n=1 Tax=Paracoccus denitrificans TaxID=266 RepID=A0A533I343_PARDE|nr:MAG: hypothetical protein DI616_15725 [Paracoccus denitrificans]